MENKELIMEDKTGYYYSNNQRIPLARESSVYAVKFVTGRDPRDGGLSRPAFKLLNEDSDNIGFIPNYNFQVYKASAERMNSELITGEPLLAEVKRLKAEPSIEYATVAYRRQRNATVSKIDDLMFATREFAVQFKANVSRQQIDEINKKHGVQIVKTLDYAQNGFLLRASEADGESGPVALSNIYYESGLTMFAHPNFVQRRHIKNVVEKKKTPKVTTVAETIGKRETSASRSVFLSRQWHLTTAKVTDAWNITKGNREIKVAILDDGIDTAHPEFAGKIVAQYDFATGSADANPKNTGDNHGTACAGVAVASGVKAFGAAPACSLMAVNTPTFLGSVEEADMFKWVCDQGADIISCSWGPEDGTGAVDPLPDNVRAAINYCVTNGRSGLGIPVFWAAGNGDESVSNDGYASNPDVIAVAASSSKETRSWYSDYGPEVFLCAPSNGDKNQGEVAIFTVDRTGNVGYNPTKTGALSPADDINYTDNFGGTSSATPLAAGITALMLSINPNLRVNEVKNILKNTCEKIDTANGNYDGNGHSDWYGYGRINALKAVEGARDFSSGGGGGTATGQPSITTQSSYSRNDQPPVFEINCGGRKMYAVEFATDAQLFNYAASGSQRNSSNFYASWEKEMLSVTPFNMPADVWNSLKNASQIYYRLHVADDNAWSNYGVTVGDDNASSAPSFSITDNSGGGGVTPDTGEISISGPASIGRNDGPPTFQIGKGGRSLYAVEVATRAELFDNANYGNERTSDNFYASWQVMMISETPFQLMDEVWQVMKSANQLYYRIHVADDNAWSNYGVSVGDSDYASAPSIQISDGSRISRNGVYSRTEKVIEPFNLSEAKKEDEEKWQG